MPSWKGLIISIRKGFKSANPSGPQWASLLLPFMALRMVFLVQCMISSSVSLVKEATRRWQRAVIDVNLWGKG